MKFKASVKTFKLPINVFSFCLDKIRLRFSFTWVCTYLESTVEILINWKSRIRIYIIQITFNKIYDLTKTDGINAARNLSASLK